MKTSIGLVVVAFAIGCGTESLPQTGETTQAIGGRCPDPDNCVLSNGGGVYTDEFGNAGIGPNNYMITRFVNAANNGGVSLEGRGINPNTGNYYSHPAGIYYARYNGVPFFRVLHVAETLTNPTFTIVGQNGVQSSVGGDNLSSLQLVVAIDDALYTISFANAQPNANPDGNATLQTFATTWNVGESPTSTQAAYCTRAPVYNNVPDPIVFQQGISVHPVTGVLAFPRSNSYVTMSCRHGGIATARWWGYVYRGDQQSGQMFAAAIQMKRASYCGDETFYTRAHTFIDIADSANIVSDSLDPNLFEASWGVTANGIRATCVNLNNLRRPGANWPPNPGGSDFVGDCIDGTHIPVNNCPLPNASTPPIWLADQLAP